MEFPSALLGVALGTVLLPSLAKLHADAKADHYSALLDWGLRLAFMLALPAAVALWVLATPLVSTLYQYGRFSVNDVVQTRDALLGYSVGLLGLIVVKILAPGFYARQAMATPVKIAFATVLVSQSLALILMYPDRTRGPHAVDVDRRVLQRGTPVLVPAQARHLHARRRAGRSSSRSSSSRCSRSPRCCSGSAARRRSGSPRTLWEKVGRLAGVCAAGAGAYFGALWLLGFRFADFNRRDVAADRNRRDGHRLVYRAERAWSVRLRPLR